MQKVGGFQVCSLVWGIGYSSHLLCESIDGEGCVPVGLWGGRSVGF